MSVRVMGNVWEHSKARPGPRLVLLAIADCAHDDGTRAFPSITELARKTGLSVRAVQYAIRELEQDGELTVQTNAGPGGVNMYCVTPPCKTCTPPVQDVQGGGARLAPGTINEPSENQNPPTPLCDENEHEPGDALFTVDFEKGFVETVAPSRPPEDDPGFLAFWSAYPRHIAKQAARKAWRAAIRAGAVPGEIIAGAEHYRDDRKRKSKGIEYTAHPATWLNGQRWMDWTEEENAARHRYSNNPFEN